MTRAFACLLAFAVWAVASPPMPLPPPNLSDAVDGLVQPSVVAPATTSLSPVTKPTGGTDVQTAMDWPTYMYSEAHTAAIAVNPSSNLSQQWVYTGLGGQMAFTGSPVESDGIVCFTASDGYLYGVNRSTGGSAFTPQLLGVSSPRGSTPLIDDGKVYVGAVTVASTETTVFCRDLFTGAPVWSTVIPGGYWIIYLARPIKLTIGGTPYVFLTAYQGSAHPFTTIVLGLRMSDGAIIYSQTYTSTGRCVGGLATDGTFLYAPFTTGVQKLQPVGPGFTTV